MKSLLISTWKRAGDLANRLRWIVFYIKAWLNHPTANPGTNCNYENDCFYWVENWRAELQNAGVSCVESVAASDREFGKDGIFAPIACCPQCHARRWMRKNNFPNAGDHGCSPEASATTK